MWRRNQWSGGSPCGVYVINTLSIHHSSTSLCTVESKESIVNMAWATSTRFSGSTTNAAKSFYLHFVGLAAVNLYILFKETNPTSRIRHCQYHENNMECLMHLQEVVYMIALVFGTVATWRRVMYVDGVRSGACVRGYRRSGQWWRSVWLHAHLLTCCMVLALANSIIMYNFPLHGPTYLPTFFLGDSNSSVSESESGLLGLWWTHTNTHSECHIQ